MVAHGRSIAVRGTKNLFFQTQRPTRRDADRREAIVAAYEIASPEMIESGDCAALLEAHAADLGRLLFRVQHKFDHVAADGCLLFRATALSRWREVYCQLHARTGELVVYRCADAEAKRALRAAAAFGVVTEHLLPPGARIIDVLDVTHLASATVVEDGGARFAFDATAPALSLWDALGLTGRRALRLAARTARERSAWLAALREARAFFAEKRDQRRARGAAAAAAATLDAAEGPAAAELAARLRDDGDGVAEAATTGGAPAALEAFRKLLEEPTAADAGGTRAAALEAFKAALEAKPTDAAAREAEPPPPPAGDADTTPPPSPRTLATTPPPAARETAAPLAREVDADSASSTSTAAPIDDLGLEENERDDGRPKYRKSISEVYSEADPAETYTLRVVDDGPLGMELQFCDEGFRVEAVVGGAALREGVAAQDVIVAIQGKSCALRDWPEAAYAPEIFFAPRPLVLTMARARKFAPSPRRPPAGDSLLDVVHSLELLDSLDAPPPPPPPKRRFARWQLASHGRWVPAAEADDDAPNSVLSDDDGGGGDDDDEPPPDARYDDDGAWSDASWSDADELGPRTP